uniref:Protein LTV1 homolog n=1 Tax=Caenorhabditis japonica TaxID=281687 RepID=A0A8R1HSS6_CAEJA
MGKKKAFIEKKTSQSFRLVPDNREKTERFQPTEEHLEEQQKYGVYYDDDYDYLQHMRAINEPMKLQNIHEEVEKTTIKTTGPPAFPPAPPLFGMVGAGKKAEFFDEDVANALEDVNGGGGELEDNFFTLAGGLVDERPTFYRDARRTENADDKDDDEEEENDQMFDDYDDEELFGEETVREIRPERTEQRVIDDAFEELMDREYQTEQIGELDGDDYDVGGALEPNAGRLHKLVNDKGVSNPEYDEELAKQYVRERMRLIEEGVIKEKEEYEIVEVDESTRKRMKWDCESFATQYTNIYNHPTLIREPRSGLSKKALRRFDKAVEQMEIAEENEDEEDVDMEEDDDDDGESILSTVSTFRPKGETPEQRNARKKAVKEARKMRRVEKKANKTMFAEEKRKLAKGRIGQIKARPI